MCDCKSCKDYHSWANTYPRVWPDADPMKLARYITSKRTGKIPADPLYAAHRRATLSWGAGRRSEFSREDLTDKSVKLFTRGPKEKGIEPDRRFPGLEFLGSTAAYVAEFERLNYLLTTRQV